MKRELNGSGASGARRVRPCAVPGDGKLFLRRVVEIERGRLDGSRDVRMLVGENFGSGKSLLDQKGSLRDLDEFVK